VADRVTASLVLGSEQETRRLGRMLGEGLPGGAVVALMGELGAGKTCLAQGLALGLGLGEEVVVASPSFTLANEYPGRVPFFHLDVYRLDGEAFAESGLDEYFTQGRGVTAVEWGEKIESLLPEERLDIRLTPTPDGGRRAELAARGEAYEALLQNIIDRWGQEKA
jgi:tRNA threonylcarbamoyladenosine biosynthesis protein TsaE